MSSNKVEKPYRTWKTKEYTPSPEMQRSLDRASQAQPPIRSITSKSNDGETKEPSDEGG